MHELDVPLLGIEFVVPKLYTAHGERWDPVDGIQSKAEQWLCKHLCLRNM